MQKFTDADGRQWQIVLDIPAARTVYQRTQVNLRARQDLQRLTGDESLWLIPDVLYVLCEAQAAKRYEALDGNVAAISAEFGRMLEPCFPAACEAFFTELADFCRRLGMQATARLTEALAKRLATLETLEAEQLGDKMVPAMDAEIQRELTQRGKTLDRLIRGTNVGKSPESSDLATSSESPGDS
jgi:hypothetical protein